MKVAIVVGHNSAAKGARALAPISEHEFTYYNRIADEMVRLARGGLTAKRFNRVKTTGYSREIDTVYAQVDDYGADISIELHFNAASPAATGTETLSSGSSRSLKLAKAMQDAMLPALGLRDRGVKIVAKTERGGRSLHAGRPPAVLVEPFFGSNTGDCRAAAKLGETGMAKMWLAGVRAYAGLPDVQVAPVADAAFLADVDIVHSGLTRQEFFDRNRAAIKAIVRAVNKKIQAEEHGEEINALTTADAFALINAQIGVKNGKVNNRHAHPDGNTGLLPLPANLAFWNGSQSADPGARLTPERNVKEYLLYLGHLKNKDVGWEFRGGVLYRDLFTQPEVVGNAKKQMGILAAVVYGYFHTENYNLGLPHGEISRRIVAAEKDPAPMLGLLRELGYKDIDKDPKIVEARIADLKAGLAMSRG
jgi:N-acetylmuramoyl-L-alanine amidase